MEKPVNDIVEKILPESKRLKIKSQMLGSKYIIKGAILKKRNIEKSDIENCPVEQKSTRNKLINKIEKDLKWAKSTNVMFEILESYKKKKLRLLEKWDECFENFEKKEKEWKQELASNYNLGDIGLMKSSGIIQDIESKFREIVNDNLCLHIPRDSGHPFRAKPATYSD